LRTRTVILVTIVAIIALTTFTMFPSASAYFVPSAPLITGVDAGQGSVSPSCLSPGCGEVPGATVTVTATPSPGWVFASWSTQTNIPIVCTSNPCTFTYPSTTFVLVLRATFDPAPIPAQPTHPINVGGTMLPLNLLQVLGPWIAAILALTVVAVETLVIRKRK